MAVARVRGPKEWEPRGEGDEGGSSEEGRERGRVAEGAERKVRGEQPRTRGREGLGGGVPGPTAEDHLRPPGSPSWAPGRRPRIEQRGNLLLIAEVRGKGSNGVSPGQNGSVGSGGRLPRLLRPPLLLGRRAAPAHPPPPPPAPPRPQGGGEAPGAAPSACSKRAARRRAGWAAAAGSQPGGERGRGRPQGPRAARLLHPPPSPRGVPRIKAGGDAELWSGTRPVHGAGAQRGEEGCESGFAPRAAAGPAGGRHGCRRLSQRSARSLSAGRARGGCGLQRQSDGAPRGRAERLAALERRGPRLQLQPDGTLRGRTARRLPARQRRQRFLRLHRAGLGSRDVVPPPHRAARRRGGRQRHPADR